MQVLRTYARVYTSDFETTTAALIAASGAEIGLQFDMPNGLRLAAIGQVLVVAGDDVALAPYRATQATLIVDDLDQFHTALVTSGADIVQEPQAVPTGRNLTARLTPEVQIEFVEWDKAQWQRINAVTPSAD
ncbi:hypothetical protein IU510_20565 [Nocardia cyriacigeorgica]|nr:hypothetical protein [Nocardia cyriacigeorgica]MBF6100455.1 hypothetical protein [Nocardia cyriacigeorgica]MBF6162054.1 hypothetical protein [Nocardia cyriacigeorgica]MBF6200884.1 hypothetical protein [Nocardia cyriacigeorgica]MBF6320289.1 hypothetical protein [Nocardia cyriacigeorgica]MBF6534225.1 hypothetical protein [Nocardia cyriacigeorgica]